MYISQNIYEMYAQICFIARLCIFCYDYANIVSIVTANKYKLENIVTNIIKLQY